LRAERVVPQPSPRPPRSRRLETRPSTPTIRPHRSHRRAAARALGVSQAQPRRMGSPDQEGLRSRSLGRQQVEDLREPPELPSLSQTHEGYRRHHRLRADPQDPAKPHQDRQATPGVDTASLNCSHLCISEGIVCPSATHTRGPRLLAPTGRPRSCLSPHRVLLALQLAPQSASRNARP